MLIRSHYLFFFFGPVLFFFFFFLLFFLTKLYQQLFEGEREFVPDPDANAELPTTGSDHSVASFLRSEKLEFSSLRHAKFSTMLFLYFLLLEDKQYTIVRYVD